MWWAVLGVASRHLTNLFTKPVLAITICMMPQNRWDRPKITGWIGSFFMCLMEITDYNFHKWKIYTFFSIFIRFYKFSLFSCYQVNFVNQILLGQINRSLRLYWIVEIFYNINLSSQLCLAALSDCSRRTLEAGADVNCCGWTPVTRVHCSL